MCLGETRWNGSGQVCGILWLDAPSQSPSKMVSERPFFRIIADVRRLERYVQSFLRRTCTIDYDDAAVRALATSLARDVSPLQVAERCFDWVRLHSPALRVHDHGDPP